nr:hypothetical protein GCM10020092_103130 [Actinoplanes digitatis]
MFRPREAAEVAQEVHGGAARGQLLGQGDAAYEVAGAGAWPGIAADTHGDRHACASSFWRTCALSTVSSGRPASQLSQGTHRHRAVAEVRDDGLDEPPVVLGVEGEPQVGQVRLQRQAEHVVIVRVRVDVRGHVRAVMLGGELVDLAQHLGSDDLDVEPARQRARYRGAQVVKRRGGGEDAGGQHDQLRVEQRAVGGEAQHRVVVVRAGVEHAEEAAEHVVDRAAVHADADRLALGNHRVVDLLGGGGDDQVVEHAAVAGGADHPAQHGSAAESAEHLAGQPGGAHPGLDDAECSHGIQSLKRGERRTALTARRAARAPSRVMR